MRVHGEDGGVKASGQHPIPPVIGKGLVPEVKKLIGIAIQVVILSLSGPVINDDLFVSGAQHCAIGIAVCPCIARIICVCKPLIDFF